MTERGTGAPGDSHVAVDLGAGSGRVVAGRFPSAGLKLAVLHRFENVPVAAAGRERWDVDALWRGIRAGLAKVAASGYRAVSVGVDAWGVDYALLDARGEIVGPPVTYRDARTAGAMERVAAILPRAEIFRATGIQAQPFNTLYQLFVHRHDGTWPDGARRLLLMPDLFHYLLSGEAASERTIASTTQLLRAGSREWASELFDRLDLPEAIMPRIAEPGTRLGLLREDVARAADLPRIAVVAPGAHDTASAVAGIPLEEGWGYISSGTWSLVGVETSRPLLDDAVMRENLTNEAGVGGRNRLLRNVMGLWILERCRREWEEEGEAKDHQALEGALAAAEPHRAILLVDDPRFFNPPSMRTAIGDFLRETGQAAPEDPGSVARIVLESLALRYAAALRRLEELTGSRIRGVRIVGGGSRNRFLNQSTADASGLPVRAGPVEATAIGNLLVQAIASGRFADLEAGRGYLAGSLPGRPFSPAGGEGWLRAARQYEALARLQPAAP